MPVLGLYCECLIRHRLKMDYLLLNDTFWLLKLIYEQFASEGSMYL